MGNLPVEVLSYDELRTRAEAFLDEHHPTGRIPIPIERIVELRLGISIVVELALLNICGVDGLPSSDGSAIYIDAGVWLHPSQNRCRFSLAEELAHIHLHRSIFESLHYTTLGEYTEAILAMDGEQRNWLEWQAKSFAGLLLVPSASFRERYERLSSAMTESDPDYKDFLITKRLARKFEVSTQVIERRRKKEGF